jgi:hypothetical protein
MRPLRYSLNVTLDLDRVDWNAELVPTLAGHGR